MAEVSRSKKFIKDIGIYAVGNLGSKLITFLLVPLYTYLITDPSQFGYYDLCLSIVLMLTPVFSFMLVDGGFRFLIEATEEDRKKAVISFVYKTLTRNSILILGITGFLIIFAQIQYLGYIVAFLIVMIFYDVSVQLIRGLGLTKYFVAAGIINSFLIGILSLVFVAYFKMQIEGIFLANIGSRALTLAFLEFKTKIFRNYFSYKFNNREINREIIKYSLPLLPSTICWWLVGSSNKFFIEYFIGLEENGLYAVAYKFASILQTLTFIFYQAWQENALRQYESSDRDKFFSSIFNNYFYVLSALVILFPFLIKLNYGWLVSPEYFESCKYMYLLSVSTMVFSLAAFFDMGYQCSKKTIYTLPGIALATVVNTVANYFLIKNSGTFGIIWSSIITFGFLFAYRAVDTRKFFKIKPSFLVLGCSVLIAFSGIIFSYSDNIYINMLYIAVILIIYVIFAPKNVKALVKNKIHKG